MKRVIKQAWISAIKFVAARLRFLSDVFFLAVAVVFA